MNPSKEDVLKSAKISTEVKEVLQKLFPDYFEPVIDLELIVSMNKQREKGEYLPHKAAKQLNKDVSLGFMQMPEVGRYGHKAFYLGDNDGVQWEIVTDGDNQYLKPTSIQTWPNIDNTNPSKKDVLKSAERSKEVEEELQKLFPEYFEPRVEQSLIEAMDLQSDDEVYLPYKAAKQLNKNIGAYFMLIPESGKYRYKSFILGKGVDWEIVTDGGNQYLKPKEYNP